MRYISEPIKIELFPYESEAAPQGIVIRVNTDWEQVKNKPFESIGEGLEVDEGVLKVTDGGASSWDDLTDKPFESLDTHDFSVSEGALKVNTTNEAEPDNTLPITSAGTYVIVGNIDSLLQTI